MTHFHCCDEVDADEAYKRGRREAEQEAALVVAAMVEQAGGEIRLGRKYLVAADSGLTVYEDPATMERVYQVRATSSDDQSVDQPGVTPDNTESPS